MTTAQFDELRLTGNLPSPVSVNVRIIAVATIITATKLTT